MNRCNTTSADESGLLETGRIIVRTGEIERRLAELGGTGSGLREKSESVPGLPPGVRKQLAFIGAIRNRAAHEGGTELSAEELQQFHAAADSVLAQLARPAPRSAPRSVRSGTPPPEKGAVPFALIPVVHLVFGLQRLYESVFPCRVPLLLLLLELGGGWLTWFGISRTSLPLTLGGAGVLFACIGAGGLDALRLPEQERPGAWLIWIPGCNLLYFLRRIFRAFGWLAFAEGAVILGIWYIAIRLAARGEGGAALLVGIISYGTSLLIWCYSRMTER